MQDLNHSIDGGIYAELIRNRAFQGDETFPSSLVGWSGLGTTGLSLRNLSQPLSKALPTSLRVQAQGKNQTAGFINAGWWGIDVKAQPYKGSFWVKGSYSGSFTIALKSNTSGETLGIVNVKGTSTDAAWTEHTYTLKPSRSAENVNNTLQITFDSSVRVSIDHCL